METGLPFVRFISSLVWFSSIALHSLGSKGTRAKMASRAANSVVRRLAHRNIDWCVSLVTGFGQKTMRWSVGRLVKLPPRKCNLQWQIRW